MSFSLSLSSQEVRPLADFLLCLDPQKRMPALWAVAEIIGVIINLKPATMISFDLTSSQVVIFQNLLANLQLQSLIEEIPIPNLPPGKKACMIFISQNLTLAKKLCAARSASLALGWCPDNPEDQKLTLKIGQLLGYPKTATEYFVYGPRDKRGIIKHRSGSDHDRYYIHSPANFRNEYKQFEDILHPAIECLCPEVATELHQDTTAYWTSADF